MDSLTDKVVGLARYDTMLLSIAACHKIDEALKIKNTARALEIYAAQALNTEAERRAAEIRIRAERRAGELLRETAKNGTRRPQNAPGPGRGKNESHDSTRFQLKDHGISKDQSSTWQKLANIPKKQFEMLVREPGASTAEILRKAEPVSVSKDPQAIFDTRSLWIWGVLTEFQRKCWDGKSMQELDPQIVAENMTVRSLQDSVRIIPGVIDWLQRLHKEATCCMNRKK